MEKVFPKGFLWGAAASSHQIEGGNSNNWSEWEKKNNQRLAVAAKSRYGGLPIWTKIKSQAESPQNYLSGMAADSYSHYMEDIDLLEQMGCNAYRFSIEWSRIEPRKGEINKAALEHYRNIVEILRQKDIEPMVTLWHWTHPIWFEEMGGFALRENLKYFYNYIDLMATNFAEKARYFLILNEPEVYAQKGYISADWPPQIKSIMSFLFVLGNLMTAHNKSYDIIKSHCADARISSAKHNSYFIPKKPIILNYLLAKLARYFANDYLLSKISEKCDFIALNHYFTREIGVGKNRLDSLPRSDMGWTLKPDSLRNALLELKRYKLPVIITENGLADANDRYRGWYLDEAVRAMKLAIGDGADLKGYMHWSLLDNFEWDSGFWPKFGLAEVDYRTFSRKLRPNALHYRDIINAEKQ